MSKYDSTFFQYFANLKRQLQVSPLNLGGTAVSSGGPPGGFTGWLPQNRVGYDVAEVALSGFASPSAYNPSGILVNASLLDNMNHIRYRLAVVEALAFGGNYISVYDDSVPVASGVTILNFGSGASATLTAPTEVTITVTASGGGADEKAKVSSNDTTTNYLENKIVAGSNVNITVLNDGANETISISSTASGSGTNLGWYSPLDYGAIGDGITDDTSAINATISAIPANGGVLYFPPGYKFLSTGNHSITKPVTVRGMGNANDFDGLDGLSTIMCSSATNSLFTVSGYKCSFENLFLLNTNGGTPSAGAGITIIDGGDLIHFNNITVHSFYNNIDIQDGFAWSMQNVFNVNPVNYGLKIQHVGFVDGGDQIIDSCTFWSDARNSASAIRLESGGGLKVNNTKIVGSGQSDTHFDYGIDIYIGAAVQTSVILLNNLSIEKVTVNGIRCITSASATSTLTGVIMSNIEIAVDDEGAGSAAIYMSDQSTGLLDFVIIGNIIGHDWASSITDEMVYLDGLNHVKIGSLIADGFGGELLTPNCTDVTTLYDNIKVSTNDTTPNALENKIVAGSNVSITTLNDGGNETLQISATGSGGGTGAYSGVKAYNSANITISNSTPTTLTFNSEYWDTSNFHSTSVNTDRLTAAASGWYQVGCMFKWDDNTTGVREAGFIKNGTTYFAYNRILPQTANTIVSFTEPVNLGAGEWVTLEVYQNRGGTLDVIYGAQYTPNFWMNYLGA